MIIVRFTSGLGNQMFQYNLYRYLAEKFKGTQVKADITWFDQFAEHQGFELERIFKRADNPDFIFDIATAADIYKCTGQFHSAPGCKRPDLVNGILRYPNRILRLFNVHTKNRRRIDQTGFEDNQIIYSQIESIDPTLNYYITGFFIEEIYYKNRINRLWDYFKFDGKLSEENQNYVNQITSTESVSIHVRRGDYLAAEYKDSFKSLGMDYYKEAAKRCKESMDNPVFFIFSDDKDFINSNFSWLDDKIIVKGNTGCDSYRDLQLMSLCKRNITANSTFSTWAGLLNKNLFAKVYYPASYMSQKESEVKTMENWLRI